MKKIIIIIGFVLILVFAGVLYGKSNRDAEGENLTVAQAYMAQFPEPMPEVIVHPVIGYGF